MTISAYHQKFKAQSDEEIQNKIDAKEEELEAIFEKVRLHTTDNIVKVAVLGCGDKRFIKKHQRLFEKYVHKRVELITFDITIEHLEEEEGVYEHDCTVSLPHGPFDITYAHVLLKFIPTKKQWNLIENSYSSLKKGGLAIHVLDREDYETKNTTLDDGYYGVPIADYLQLLDQKNVKYNTIPIKYGLALVIQK